MFAAAAFPIPGNSGLSGQGDGIERTSWANRWRWWTGGMLILFLLWAAGGEMGGGVAMASYSSGFEGSEYVNATRLSNVTDSSTGSTWVVFSNVTLGSTVDVIASTAHPGSGSKHIRLTDTSNAASNNITARLNLGNTVTTDAPFTISFRLAVTGLNSGGSNPVITLGEDSNFGNTNHWFSISPASDAARTLVVSYRTASMGGTSTAFRAKLSDGVTNYQYTESTYFDVQITIDPATNRYTSICIGGIEQVGLGSIPANMYIPATATPAKVFCVYSTSAAVGTIDIDDVNIASAVSMTNYYVSGFEGSEYVGGTRLNSITDSTSTTAWAVESGVTLGSTVDAVASTSHPNSGSKHIRLTDTSSSANNNVTARLSLGSMVPTDQSFVVSFRMSTTGFACSGNNPNITLGENTAWGTTNHWISISPAMDIARTVIVSYRTAVLSGTSTAFRAKLADGTTNYQYTDGTYFDVQFIIDPISKRYISIRIGGIEQVGLGNNPTNMYIPATSTPAMTFRAYSSSPAIVTMDIDDISITPVVEQPSGAWLMDYAPGVIRPDQGTIQFTIAPDRPNNGFGNGWDFLFKMVPGQAVSSNANTLMGIYMPSLSGGSDALSAVARSDSSGAYLYWTVCSFTANQAINVAMTWSTTASGGSGKYRLYINGSKVSETNFAGELTPMPALFSVSRMNPFNASQMKISSVELTGADIIASPGTAFVSDTNTTYLATNKLCNRKIYASAWNTSTGYHAVVPIWNIDKQNLVQGTAVKYPVLTVNQSSTTKTYVLQFTVLDANGNTVMNDAKVLNLPPASGHRYTEISLPLLDDPSLYQITCTATLLGGSSKSYVNSVLLAPASETAVADGTLKQYLGCHYDLLSCKATTLQRAGIEWVRTWSDDTLLWFNIEPVAGVYSWSRADELVAQANAQGIKLVGLLGNPPRWAATGRVYDSNTTLDECPGRWKPAIVAEWTNYVTQVVNRYKNSIKCWEIYNEVDYHPPGMAASFSGSTEEYYYLLQAAYVAIKNADPTALVSTSGFSLNPTTDQNMVYNLINTYNAQNYFDAFAMHAYQGLARVDEMQAIINPVKPTARYWQTEQAWLGVTDAVQRYFLTPAIYAWFLNENFEKYINFGFNEVQFNKYTFSPTGDQWVSVAFQNQMRKCNSYEGMLTFTGSPAFSVRHQFLRTDGKTMTMLGAQSAVNRISASNEFVAYDAFGLPLAVIPPDAYSDYYRVTISTVAYLVSDEPLTIELVEELQGPPLYTNGGFESYVGDPLGGLEALTPANWVLRETTYDPSGDVDMSNDAYAGTYAITTHSSGAGRVYAYQDCYPPTPGIYQLTARMKKASSSQTGVPYLAIYDRTGNQVYTTKFTAVGTTYTSCSMQATIPAISTNALAIIVGIIDGSGDVLIDDVQFIRLQAIDAGPTSSPLPTCFVLRSSANGKPVKAAG